MSIPAKHRERVRRRAGFACEYCNVSEAETGGELTVDHFQPQSKGGGNTLENLVYCCQRCNEYKSDYWPNAPGQASLWNPRREPSLAHIVEGAEGELLGITTTGIKTVEQLRLNRPALIVSRRRQTAEEERLLARLTAITALLEQLSQQVALLEAERQILLMEQGYLLQLILDRHRGNV